MPGFLLHQGADVVCTHQGFATPSLPEPRVLVSNLPVVPLPGPWVVGGCTFAPPAGNGPCVSATWTTGSTRVRSLGRPLLLLDGLATCQPTATPLLVRGAQTRVAAI